ncbi:cytochrome P450 2K1-like isoform X2 [Paralichthys olivaceus]|uniref:cytochrome P450 2K1-like isoform X2 n=1 Tax=Paralichthys olivaceus TaxID=8255 RepID=UPI003750EB58
MFEDLLQSSASASLFGAIVLLLLYLLTSSLSSHTKRREPPGPKPLPLLGNLLQVDLKRLDSSLFHLSKQYGPVFTVYLGLKKVVVLAGYRTVKQALVNHADEFGDREVTPIFYDFDKENDKAFNNSRTLAYAASNIISSLVFGKRFEYSDPELYTFVDRDRETIYLTGSMSILIYNAFPWLGPYLKNWRALMKNREINVKNMRRIIAEMKEMLNPEMCRCFIDAFLSRKQNLEESGIKDSHYHDDNLLFSVTNLFAAGTDTTATTLQWSLLLMAKYPHVQDKVQEELSRVIGSHQVRVEDRKNLPYTNAVIHETQRLANIGPMAIPHKTSQDVTFQGYFIKAGTTVFPLLTSVLYDESEWETPHTFNPSHFLDAEGKFTKRDAFMPFSAGRRMCLGESLARMELFLFFTSLLQHFRFTPSPGVTEGELDLTPAVGLTLNPAPHELCAVSRQ